jgi:uncharacterized protein YjiS (DUF1127 family)
MNGKKPTPLNEAIMSTQTQDVTHVRTPIIGRVRAAAQRWVAYRKTLSELEQLGDRDLSDIGIGRGDIHRIAREHALSVVPQV